MSTVATHLNIVIVALRLLADMIQTSEEPLPTAMAPSSCPPEPPASPTSPLLRKTTCPSITWAPCGSPGLQLQLRQLQSPTDHRAPPPSPTSSAGTNTPPAPSLSPFPCIPSPSSPPPHPSPPRSPQPPLPCPFFSCSSLPSSLSRTLPSRLCLPFSLDLCSTSFSLSFRLPRFLCTPGSPSFSRPTFSTSFCHPFLPPCLSMPPL